MLGLAPNALSAIIFHKTEVQVINAVIILIVEVTKAEPILGHALLSVALHISRGKNIGLKAKICYKNVLENNESKMQNNQ